MKKRFSQYSLWLCLLGMVVGVGQYFTHIHSPNILYVYVIVYLIGFSCGIIAFGKQEKGLMKYFSLISFAVIPIFIMASFLFLAMNFGEK
ncbi:MULTISPECIES: hypothetical protein [Priestia]|uniref:hypothetical protein n=1 Tax=Priestia TaxID=2800373 RepID=UPI00189DBC8F|nr:MULTISPECIES: hypothetical protein [Priestia]MCM3792729.1 hypothetical protein [Priestia megaterium]